MNVFNNEFLDFAKHTDEDFQRVWDAIGAFTEAQRRTEERLEALVDAQRRIEEELRKLVEEHRETRKQLDGLTQAFGYTLENESYRALPRLLRRGLWDNAQREAREGLFGRC